MKATKALIHPVGLLLFLFGVLAIVAGTQNESDQELIYLLSGFSAQSGLKIGQPYVAPTPPVGNDTQENPEPLPIIIHRAEVLGNNSEFTICLRFKAYYQRPETILLTAYSEKETLLVIGVDEIKEQVYFKYSVPENHDELARINFDWLPRVNFWEHICFVKSKLTERDHNATNFHFYHNGIKHINASVIPAEIDRVTLLMLGQSDPPSLSASFSGEIAHFFFRPNSLSPREILLLAECKKPSTSSSVTWKENLWRPLNIKSNTTQVEVTALPVAMHVDKRSICDNSYDVHMLPLYRKQSREYHLKICSQLGGSIADVSKLDHEQLRKFAIDLYLSAEIPRVVLIDHASLTDPAAAVNDSSLAEDEEDGEYDRKKVGMREKEKREIDPKESKPSTYTTPLNMQSCFTNEELILWVDNSTKQTAAMHGHPLDDEKKKSGEEAPKICPFHILSNGTLIEKCGIDPKACSICILPRTDARLTLRGLCAKSWLKDHRQDKSEISTGGGSEEFDTAFLPKSDKLTGEIVFTGLLGSRIRKQLGEKEEETEVEDRNGDWILESLVSPYRNISTAVLKKIPSTQLPVGKNKWEMVTTICAAAANISQNTAVLSLTACKSGQFTCKSGDCIPLSDRCDLYHGCDGGEDEDECDILALDDGYKLQIAPKNLTKGVPWPVYIGVDVVSFPQITVIEQKLLVNFYLSLRWSDNRLTYHNLKEGIVENALDPEKLDDLWIPRLGLLNGLSEFNTIVTKDEAKFYRGYIWKRNDSVDSGLETSTEDGLFDGLENPIVLKRQFYQEFTCDFDLTWYPFDQQLCFMNFTVQGQTSKSIILRAEERDVVYLGPKYLVEYQVEFQHLVTPELEHSSNFSTATVHLYFRRRVVYHILNIFLQSFLLILTGYMSLFFLVNNFSDRVMVALTVLLVMASLQTSVQTALPKTSYFKFIDWWILYSLNTQIALMAFHTFLGLHCAREYRQYRESICSRSRLTMDESDVRSSSGGGGEITLDKSIISAWSGSDPCAGEFVSPEEYSYPVSSKINRIVNIGFLVVFAGFNIVYWSVAAAVYFSTYSKP